MTSFPALEGKEIVAVLENTTFSLRGNVGATAL
jgi:hypothetical protein